MAKDPILHEFERTANLDEIVFTLQGVNWSMRIQAHGPYTPRINLHKAFLAMFGNLPEEDRNRVRKVYYNRENPGSRFAGIMFEYKGGYSWIVYPPDPLHPLEGVGSETSRP